MKLLLRAYAPMQVQRLGRWGSFFFAIALTDKARNVLVITICIFEAIWQIRECPRANIEGGTFDFHTGTFLGCSFVMGLCTPHKYDIS